MVSIRPHVRFHVVRLILNFQVTCARNFEPYLIFPLSLISFNTRERLVKLWYLPLPFLAPQTLFHFRPSAFRTWISTMAT